MKEKILFFDIESSGLDADWGNILCIGYKWLGQPAHVISINDFRGWKNYDDSKVLGKFLEVLETASLIVGHNIVLFDIPFIQARMTKGGLGVWPTVAHVDTYFVAKSKLRISSKSLDRLSHFLGCKHKKSPVEPETWLAAQHGDIKALGYIKKHCKADVEVEEEVYLKLRPMMRRHPVIGDYGACHNCGKETLQKRGRYTTTQRGPQERFTCTTCGAWTHRPVPKEKK